jgi:hypothetical protein
MTPPVPVGYEAGWASELVWIQSVEEKSFASAENRTVCSQTAVWATPASKYWKGFVKFQYWYSNLLGNLKDSARGALVSSTVNFLAFKHSYKFNTVATTLLTFKSIYWNKDERRGNDVHLDKMRNAYSTVERSEDRPNWRTGLKWKKNYVILWNGYK